MDRLRATFAGMAGYHFINREAMTKFNRTHYEVHTKYVPHDSWGEIRKQYGMSTRPFHVPVMQYVEEVWFPD